MKKIFILTCLTLIFTTLTVFTTLPDLSVLWLLTNQGSQDKFIVGKEIKIQCTTLKEGTITSNWSSILKVNGAVLKEGKGQGQSKPGFGSWWPYQITKPGKNEIECILDYKNDIVESDEMNNKATLVFYTTVVMNNNTTVQINDLQKRIPKDIKNENIGNKANWMITRLESVPVCYTAPGQFQQESNHNLTFEFKSVPDAAQVNELIISGKFVSSNGTIAKPPLSISAIASAWADGGSSQIDWGGHSLLVTKVNSKFIKMTMSNFKIPPGTSGDYKIFITAQSKDAQGIYYTEENNLAIQPCAQGPLSR